MGGIVGGIQVDGDAPGLATKPLAVAFDHEIGESFSHPVDILAAYGILEAGESGLGGERLTRDGISTQQHLVDGIVGQSRGVIGVGITAGDAKDPLRKQFPNVVLDPARVAAVRQALGQPLGQPQSEVGRLEQNRPAVRTALLLVEPDDYRPPNSSGNIRHCVVISRASTSLRVGPKFASQLLCTTRRLFYFLNSRNYPG